MRKRMAIVFLISLFTLFVFAGAALGAVDAKRASKARSDVFLPVDGAHPPEALISRISPVMYEGKVSDCEAINSEATVLQKAIWGTTYYDYQKNGSMGRMIAVSPAGYKHMVFHETEGPYPANPRYVTYNCKDPSDVWLGPTRIDGGTGINAGYAQMLTRFDGAEVALYHRTAGSPLWNSSMAVEDISTTCYGYFADLYDLPDFCSHPMTEEPDGMWPKGCLVYVPHDPEPDSEYLHYVVTESGPAGYTGAQTISYGRCVFKTATQIECYSPEGHGPYTRNAGQGNASPLDVLAPYDTVHTIAGIIVTSPVSKKVAIVYTKNREDAQVNNDVYYIESTNNGDDWIASNPWNPVKHNVTSYPAGDGPRAYCDVAACYDYNDTLHIVWNAHYYDSIAGTVTYAADLYHWRQGHSITMIAPGPSDGIAPGSWNRTISKPSISAKNPIYHPGGDPDDSVFVFVTWTQFNAGDNSAGGMTNGDIYADVSVDAGSTWTRPFNLTNTNTDGCAAGECLSEHWSSLAENMYDGDLYIEYVCDRDAGGIVQDEGTWTDNDMMYLHVEQLPAEPHCGISQSPRSPSSLTLPPIKVAPDGSRIVSFRLNGIYNLGGTYTVGSSDARVVPSPPSGSLSPGDSAVIELSITCTGEDFITAIITVNGCGGTEDDTTFSFPVHVVCSDDYQECPIHPCTKIVKDNCKIIIEICVNSQEFKWLKLIQPEENQQVVFSEGAIIATTTETGDTVVFRQDYKETYIQARDTIKHVQGEYYYEPEDVTFKIQKIHIRNSFPYFIPPLAPWHCHWVWIDVHKQIIIADIGAPDWWKDIVIKKKWIDYSPPPAWWPDPTPYPGHDEIYFGLFADVDAAFDEGGNGYNTPGYDETREMVWFQGWANDSLEEPHYEYLNQYVGLAFTDDDGNVVEPMGCHVVINDSFLYPQDGWGWLDNELYQLASDTTGVYIHDLPPDSTDPMDRSVVMTAAYIPAGGPEDTTFEASYVLVEIATLDDAGLQKLQDEMDDARDIVVPIYRDLGLLDKYFDPGDIICGDANVDGIIDSGDIVKLLNYLYGGYSPPPWPLECRADANGDGVVDSGDIVKLLNYLYGGYTPPQCPTHCYYDCSTSGE